MSFLGKNRFDADKGIRGGNPNPDQTGGASTDARGSFGSDGQEPHSSAGFRRALEKTARSGNRLKDQLPEKTSFAGKDFKKPNYFAQGGRRHGMHIGSGAPAIAGATDTGADFGE